MPYDIIIGRDQSDKKRFGNSGLIYLGKGYVTMGTYTSLSNNIYMDVARSHVVLVAGKRGSGKSYTLGVITEEIANLAPEVARNIASVMFDTMGIFWTMKFKNEKEKYLLNDWGIEAKGVKLTVFVPSGKTEEYRSKNIPFDATFALQPSELDSDDWVTTFNLTMTSLEGALITSVISELKKTNNTYSIGDIIYSLNHASHAQTETKQITASLFEAADAWGVFSKDGYGTKISEIIKPGATSVIDLSVYSAIGTFNVRGLVIGLISRKIFQERIDARKQEEIETIEHGVDYNAFSPKRDVPIVWLCIDEAHEFLPKVGKTPATDALVQILREGRQPGISLVLATQQPGQIHDDVMTQSDIVIAHRVTSKSDVEALNRMMQTYLLENIQKNLDSLPSLKGSAIILDDNSERIYPMRMRPRFTWHGGESPAAVKGQSEI